MLPEEEKSFVMNSKDANMEFGGKKEGKIFQ
jgi:hypothetical protein